MRRGLTIKKHFTFTFVAAAVVAYLVWAVERIMGHGLTCLCIAGCPRALLGECGKEDRLSTRDLSLWSMLSNSFRNAFKTEIPIFLRNYALSRFPDRTVGVARARQTQSKRANTPHEKESLDDESRVWHTTERPPASDPEEGMHALLMGHKALIVERFVVIAFCFKAKYYFRQIEMLNIFIGFEQCNKYTISTSVLSA